MLANDAPHTDAPCLSRPLRGKGRASLRRAGKRERWASHHRLEWSQMNASEIAVLAKATLWITQLGHSPSTVTQGQPC